MSTMILVIVTDDAGNVTATQRTPAEVARLLSAESLPAYFPSEEGFATWLDQTPDYSGDTRNSWYSIKDFPGDGYSVALLTARPCNVGQVDALAAYFFEGPFAGEYYGTTCADEFDGEGRLFFLNTDFTKSRHDDWTDSIGDLWEHLRDGSPVRKTDKKGPGTKGTRAVEGLHCDFWLAFR